MRPTACGAAGGFRACGLVFWLALLTFRFCRSCSRRGAAEGDFEASLSAFAAVAQNAGLPIAPKGRPKAILKHHFPLSP